MTEFTAQHLSKAARLTWATASEKHSAWFEVQASADGNAFRAIGWVAAAGSSLVRHDYAFTDASLLAYGAPQVYYRLCQTDQDGTATYSLVRVVMVQGACLTRLALTTQANAAGTAALVLPQSLSAGLYLVRSETGPALRLTVE